MNFFFKVCMSIASIIILVLLSCKNRTENDNYIHEEKVGIIDEDTFYLSNIDSIIAEQVYKLRIEALDKVHEKYILNKEAKKQNESVQDIVEKQINKKCDAIGYSEVKDYIIKYKPTHIDTNNIKSYLLLIKQKERKRQYVDSLKQYYNLTVKLQPPLYRTIDTRDLFSHNLTKLGFPVVVFIISDFQCSSCQNSEKTLQKLYEKYKDQVTFNFVYFSEYIDKCALANAAAAEQNKSREMHDLIFANSNLLGHDSIYKYFAKEINLNIDEFNNSFNSDQILLKLIKNKELLISNNIYSTPTFIVNGKILDKKYAIDYLEDVIDIEIKLKM